jgi:probable rRNA maturation factor
MPSSDLDLDIQYAVPRRGVPSPASFRRWALAALAGEAGAFELSLRVVDEEESRALNAAWRGKDRPTNVLSFPTESDGLPVRHLGDLAICAGVVASEARAWGKAERAHWAHMTVHGVLHLLGHDHAADDEAGRMEALEREILAGLGFADPYLPDAELPETREGGRAS